MFFIRNRTKVGIRKTLSEYNFIKKQLIIKRIFFAFIAWSYWSYTYLFLDGGGAAQAYFVSIMVFIVLSLNPFSIRLYVVGYISGTNELWWDSAWFLSAMLWFYIYTMYISRAITFFVWQVEKSNIAGGQIRKNFTRISRGQKLVSYKYCYVW